MNIDPEIVDMIAKFVAVNAVATLLMLALSYGLGAIFLRGLRWLEAKLTVTAPSHPDRKTDS